MILLNVLPKTRPQNTHKRPQKSSWYHDQEGFQPPSCTGHCIKKQLIRSVRLLNSAGGVYFVIAAVPMSL